VHFEQGREYHRAVRYLYLAGETALQRSAHQEAIIHLSKGLELLTTLPDIPERTHQELRLQITLGPALMVAKGQTAAEVGAAYTRARELCQQLDETVQLFPVLIGLWRFHIGRNRQTARDVAEQCLALAEPTHDPALLLEAHMALGRTLQLLEEFVPARQHLEQGIALYTRRQHHAHASLYVRDPGVVCGIYAAHVLWYLGYPDQALVRSHDALTLAQDLAHPLSLALALHEAAVLHRFRREPLLAQERAAAVISLVNEQELGPYMLGRAMIELGWALAVQGHGEAGIIQLQQGLDTLRVRGIPTQEGPDQLAEAYLHQGRAEEGLCAMPQGPIGFRLKGELLLAQEVKSQKQEGTRDWRLKTSPSSQAPSLKPPVSSEAEVCFLQAIDIAQQQQAKSLELRATMSLARLWQSQGKKTEAHQMLAEIYDWFTEGFDTKDLQEAGALIEELDH
jgi:tetratricopeptide (TPR) repeat protein